MEYNIFIFLLLFIFLIVSFYYVRLIKNIYTSFNNKDSNLLYLVKINYESCVIFIINLFLLLFFIFNNMFIVNFVKIMLINFFFI